MQKENRQDEKKGESWKQTLCGIFLCIQEAEAEKNER